MKDVNIEELVNYHVKDFLIEPTLFQQVYEEITTFAYWLKGFQANNILEIGLNRAVDLIVQAAQKKTTGRTRFSRKKK